MLCLLLAMYAAFAVLKCIKHGRRTLFTTSRTILQPLRSSIHARNLSSPKRIQTVVSNMLRRKICSSCRPRQSSPDFLLPAVQRRSLVRSRSRHKKKSHVHHSEICAVPCRAVQYRQVITFPVSAQKKELEAISLARSLAVTIKDEVTTGRTQKASSSVQALSLPVTILLSSPSITAGGWAARFAP